MFRFKSWLLSALLACNTSLAWCASDLGDVMNQMKPGYNGLPAALDKPLYISVCFFDMQGKNGEFYNRAKDTALIAQRWNVFINFKVFMDERITAESFKAGECEAAAILTSRASQFNPFIGSLEAIGAIPTYDQLKTVLRLLIDPRLLQYAITEPYQVLFVLPLGSVYLFSKDRRIDSLEKTAGKKIAVLDWDKARSVWVERIGAQPLATDLSTIFGKFNNGHADMVPLPALTYAPFEMARGLGENGGIYKLPLAQMTASLVINRDKLKEKLPDLDSKLDIFRAIETQYSDQILDQIFRSIIQTEKAIPAKYWITPTAQNEKKYLQALHDIRIQMMNEGYYDPRMLKILKKVRCKTEPGNSECSRTDE